MFYIAVADLGDLKKFYNLDNAEFNKVQEGLNHGARYLMFDDLSDAQTVGQLCKDSLGLKYAEMLDDFVDSRYDLDAELEEVGENLQEQDQVVKFGDEKDLLSLLWHKHRKELEEAFEIKFYAITRPNCLSNGIGDNIYDFLEQNCTELIIEEE